MIILKNTNIAFATIFFCISCFDLYYYGIGRVFDYLAFVFLLCILNISDIIKNIKLLIALVTPFIFGILFFQDIKALLGILFGISFGVLFYCFCDKTSRNTDKYIIGVLLFFIFAFFVQFIAFKFLNTYIDLAGFLSSIPSRNYIPSIDFFRASGLFQEPNSYAVFCYFAITVLLYGVRYYDFTRDVVLILLIMTMAMSNSLFGIIAFPVLCILALVNKVRRSVIAIGLMVLALTYNVWLESVTISRFIDIKSESSIQERLIGAKFLNQMATEQTVFELLLGNGFKNIGFQVQYGTNSFSYLLYNCGVFGLLSFLAIIYKIDKSKFKQKTGLVLFFFINAPYFTYAIFWFWLILLFYNDIKLSMKKGKK